MEIKGKVHCFFEQRGTFKNEFRKLGIQAEDYDIQNKFGQTDHVVDLFGEIENAYDEKASIFDNITTCDLMIVFFPCIHFCDAKTLFFRGQHIAQKGWSLNRVIRQNIIYSTERERFFQLLMKFVVVITDRNLRAIIENPYNPSGMTFLENNFIPPTIIDKNRMLRGDYFVKPTAYWFINCENTQGYSKQKDKPQKAIMKCKRSNVKGICSTERSMISPEYARNFICDFILGKKQDITQPTLFDDL